MDHSTGVNNMSNETKLVSDCSEVMMFGSDDVKFSSGIILNEETEEPDQNNQRLLSDGKEETPLVESLTDMDISDGQANSSAHLIDEVLNYLVKNKKAHFRSQQRGDPDLSVGEKREIARSLFKKNPSGFLSRYGHLLTKTHLDYFSTFQYPSAEEKEEVMYHLSHLGSPQCKSTKTNVKNRRYDALQKMINRGSYFLMEEMQSRNPLLYEQLVGRYQTDEEKLEEKDDTTLDKDLPLMQYFAKRVEKEQMEKFKQQQEMDEASDGYDDDSSDEISKPQKEDTSESSANLWGEYRGQFQSETDKSSAKKKKVKERKEKPRNFQEASEEEKAFYRQEFQAAMYHSFLSGNDKDFDYSTVDNNSEYDCVDMRERDEQDQYFDDESPDSGPYASMDVTEDTQQNSSSSIDVVSDISKPISPNPSENDKPISPNPSENDNEESMSEDVCDRLTEDDLQNLKSFASSWVEDHTRSTTPSDVSESIEPKTAMHHVDIREKVTIVSPPKVPVKKNHKIKINLKTKEM